MRPGILILCSALTHASSSFIQVRDLFAAKYGKEFVYNALDNVDNVVNERVSRISFGQGGLFKD